MRSLAYLKACRADLKEIAAYIAEESGSIATSRRFVAALRGQCEKIARLSTKLGRPRDDLRPGIRTFAFKRYVLVLRYEGDRLEIVNIIHGARDIEALFRGGEP